MKNTKEPETETWKKVKLKPILGLKPGVYLTIFYGFIAFLLLASVSVWPSFQNPGSVATVLSTPPGASVYLDDQLLGETPLYSVNLPRADEAQLVIKKPGFQTQSFLVTSRAPLFLSLIFPDRIEKTLALVAESPDSVVEFHQKELAYWLRQMRFSERNPAPPLFTHFRRDLESLSLAENQTAVSLLVPYARFVGTPLVFLDFTSAVGLPASPETPWKPFLEQWQNLIASHEPSQPLALTAHWIYYNLPAEWKPAFQEQVSLDKLGAEYLAQLVAQPLLQARVLALQTSDLNLNIPQEIQTSRSYVFQDTPVTNQEYWEFVRARPDWSPAQTQTLVSQGKADENYLKHWSDGAPRPEDRNKPVTYVSYYAAQAYVAFKNSGRSSRVLYDLPHELEWEKTALSAGTGSSFAAGANPYRTLTEVSKAPAWARLRGFRNNVFEWQKNDFGISDGFFRWSLPDQPFWKLKSIRGAAWTSPYIPSVYDRGAMAADWCSEAVGFRLVELRG